MKDRVKLYPHVAEMAGYFFNEEYPFDQKSVEKRLKKEGALDGLRAIRGKFASLGEFSAEATDKALHELAAERGVSAGDLVHPVRVAVSGTAAGPSLFHMLDVMGKDRVLRRMDRALAMMAG